YSGEVMRQDLLLVYEDGPARWRMTGLNVATIGPKPAGVEARLWRYTKFGARYAGLWLRPQLFHVGIPLAGSLAAEALVDELGGSELARGLVGWGTFCAIYGGYKWLSTISAAVTVGRGALVGLRAFGLELIGAGLLRNWPVTVPLAAGLSSQLGYRMVKAI